LAKFQESAGRKIGRTYRFISRELGLKLIPTSPIDYVPRFCSGLTLRGEVQSKAVEILRQASEKELTSGRGPTGVAAAAIYIASILCGDRRTQREVAEVAGITEVTIRNRYKELAEELDIENHPLMYVKDSIIEAQIEKDLKKEQLKGRIKELEHQIRSEGNGGRRTIEKN